MLRTVLQNTSFSRFIQRLWRLWQKVHTTSGPGVTTFLDFEVMTKD